MLHTLAFILAIAATVIGAVVFTRGAVRIAAGIRAGQGSAPGRTEPRGRRTLLVLKEMLGHGRFTHRPVVRVAHWLVMVAFPLLFLSLVTGYGQLLSPDFALPIIGHAYIYEWVIEAIAWLCTAAIIALMVIRYIHRPRGAEAATDRATTDPAVTGSSTTDSAATADPAATTDSAATHATPASPLRRRSSRFTGSNQAAAIFVEAVVLGVAVCVIALRAFEYAYGLATSAPWATVAHFPLTAWLGATAQGWGAPALATVITLTALLKIVISVAWFVVVGLQPTMGVAWHRFLAIVNIYTRREVDGSPALGPLPPLRVGEAEFTVDALDDLDEDASLGVGTVADFSWKALLDFATCTECGRCQDICPAWNTGKPLSPKTLVTTLRDHAAEPDIFEAAQALVPEVIEPDVLWSCTMCGACVDQCPVDIEHVDHIAELRRHQVLMESAFPNEFAGMFRHLENKGNPWGQAPRKRMDWAKKLPFEVPQVGIDIESLAEVDYLLWVGCAGAYENRAKKTVQALAELLHVAGVSFAVLGDAEGCTGDPARRAGNEMLFQMLAAQNVEMLNEAGATKIVVSCAHCFNTLAREYPQLGGQYEVVHHTQLLNRLVREGALRLAPPPEGTAEPVTYHDPCFLGRHNQIYAPPRELLAAMGTQVTEMPRNRETAMCCGAGGARVWTEETIGARINQVRAQEAANTGATTVATACPFCTQMISDGAAAQGTDMQVRDVATLMLDAVHRAQAADADPGSSQPGADPAQPKPDPATGGAV